MRQTLSPTAAPLSFLDLVHSIGAAARGDGAQFRFREQIRGYFNARSVFLLSSGKASLCVSLIALRKNCSRREVIIPAYASYCLASAVARTGLAINLCDIDPRTLDFDLSRLRHLVSERTLAIIPVHNYGLMCNMDEILKIAREKGALVVEDAAQAAGAVSHDGRKAGTLGDVGIVSLGRGKNICTLGGGVILTNSATPASFISKEAEKPGGNAGEPALSIISRGIALSLFLKPSMYTIPSSMPLFNIGANTYDPEFPCGPFHPLQAEVGMRTFCYLDRYNAVRIRNAEILKQGLDGMTSLRIPEPDPSGRSVYLRFPVLFQSPEERDRVFHRLSRSGLGASLSYPTPLDGIDAFRKHIDRAGNYPGASFTAKRILTLPTHPFVKGGDLVHIIKVIGDLTHRRRCDTL